MKQVGINTPLGEKPSIWLKHETVDESPKKMLYMCAMSCGENLEIRGPQMHNTILGKEISRHWGYPMFVKLQNKKILFWEKGQRRDALDGFSHLEYVGVRESMRT